MALMVGAPPLPPASVHLREEVTDIHRASLGERVARPPRDPIAGMLQRRRWLFLDFERGVKLALMTLVAGVDAPLFPFGLLVQHLLPSRVFQRRYAGRPATRAALCAPRGLGLFDEQDICMES
jgi:hypothetical protein